MEILITFSLCSDFLQLLFLFLSHSFSLFWSFPLFSNLFSLTLPDHLSLILNIISSVNLRCTVGQPLQRAQQWSLATRVFVYLPSVPSYHCHDNQPVAMPIFRCNRIVFVQAVCARVRLWSSCSSSSAHLSSRATAHLSSVNTSSRVGRALT